MSKRLVDIDDKALDAAKERWVRARSRTPSMKPFGVPLARGKKQLTERWMR
jgi:hypothetical protein